MDATLQFSFTSDDTIARLAEVQDRIRKEPQRADLRILLFQIYCLIGEWTKANNQLVTLSELSDDNASLARTYSAALRCELLRAEVFSGTRAPLVLGEPADWIAWLIEAVRLDANGQHAEAATLRDQAYAAAPATSGRIDNQPFDWIADADSRLGPVCEALIDGKYYWVPFARLKGIAIEAPTDLRDFVWMPATLTFATGGENVALIPTRYPGTEKASDDRLRMARLTAWQALSENVYAGLGQRMFATDQGEYSLMDVRSITLEPVAEGSA